MTILIGCIRLELFKLRQSHRLITLYSHKPLLVVVPPLSGELNRKLDSIQVAHLPYTLFKPA